MLRQQHKTNNWNQKLNTWILSYVTSEKKSMLDTALLNAWKKQAEYHTHTIKTSQMRNVTLQRHL